MRWLSLILPFLVSSAFAENPWIQPVVYRGKPVRVEGQTWRSVVRVDLKDGFCTGTLISKSHVLTAAHCVQGEEGIEIAFYKGTNKRIATRPVREKFIHEEFKQSILHDLAILRFEGDFPSEDYRAVGLLADEQALEVSTALTIAGYGFLNRRDAGSLNFGQVAIIEKAASLFAVYVKGPIEQSPCSGDSGGPAFLEVKGVLWLAGVTSVIPEIADTCQMAGGGIYSSVPFHLDWILSVLNRP